MGLVDYGDDHENDDAPGMDDEGKGDDCVSCARDIIDAIKADDPEALADALKQFDHYADKEGESSNGGNEHGKGILAIIGKPEK